MGPRASLDGQKISSPPGFDPGPSSPQSVAIPTELPGPQIEAVCTYKTLFTCLPNNMVSHTKKEYLEFVNYFYPLNIFLVKNTATFEYSTTTDVIPSPSVLSHL